MVRPVPITRYQTPGAPTEVPPHEGAASAVAAIVLPSVDEGTPTSIAPAQLSFEHRLCSQSVPPPLYLPCAARQSPGVATRQVPSARQHAPRHGFGSHEVPLPRYVP